MENIRKIAYLFFLIFFSLFNAHTTLAADISPIDVSSLDHYQTTTDHYEYFQDPSMALEIHDAIKSTKWKISEPGVTNRGFTKNNSWMRFKLNNPSEQAIDLVLEYVDPAVVSLDMYTSTSAKDKSEEIIFQKQNFTFNKPVSSRPITHYRPAFPLHIEANSTTDVLIRLAPGDKFITHTFTSMRLWEANNFYHSSDKELSFMFLLLLSEIFMGITTLILYFVLKKRVFLFYALFVFSAASLFASLSGLWSYFIAQEHYEIWMVVFQIGICQVASFVFVREFLNTKVHMPTADLFLQSIIVINVIGLILNLMGKHSMARVIIDYTALAYIFLIPIGLRSHKKGVPHSLLFTLSWVIFIIGMAIASMRLRGYIDDSLLAQRLIYIGGFLEISLLTSIMVLTVNRLSKEKQALETRYRKTLEESADKLSLKVNEQTLELKKAKEKAENEARLDVLTGINNRRAFLEIANQFIARVNRSKASNLYMAIIDIDHFKHINDTHGHSAGDKVLTAVAQALKNTIRDIDSVSRIGGEEFAIAMESDTQKGVLELCERLRTNIENLISEFDQQKIKVTISVGLSEYQQGDTLDQFMQKSDKALYLAKLQGRNQVIVFS